LARPSTPSQIVLPIAPRDCPSRGVSFQFPLLFFHLPSHHESWRKTWPFSSDTDRAVRLPVLTSELESLSFPPFSLFAVALFPQSQVLGPVGVETFTLVFPPATSLSGYAPGTLTIVAPRCRIRPSTLLCTERGGGPPFFRASPFL